MATKPSWEYARENNFKIPEKQKSCILGTNIPGNIPGKLISEFRKKYKFPGKELEKYFTGPTAAALSSDPITTAKILTKFAKSHDKLKIVAGFMDGKVLDQKEVAIIATLPSLEEARAKIVGILSSPAQKLVSILLAPGSKIANLARAKSLKN